MIIKQLFDTGTCTYSYLLIDEVGKEAAIIDSVKEQTQRDIDYIRSLDVTLKYSFETHIHADHVTGGGTLREAFAVKTVVHENSNSDCADILTKEGDVFYLGDQEITVLFTPGHTNTCISYLIDGFVFTGDALLIRACGRTDFQAGDAATLYDSITQKLFTLPDSTIVYPGHDYAGFTSTTIDEEKRLNPRLGGNKSKAEFVEIMDSMDLPNPRYMSVAIPGNLACGSDSN